MKPKPYRATFLAILFAFIVLAIGLFAWARVSAQQELPLAEMALQEYELPKAHQILSAGPTTFQDVSQPINLANSVAFRVHQFHEAYKINVLAEEAEIGHYLYRYDDKTQAENQAKALITYALQDPRVRPVQPRDDGNKEHRSLSGQTVQFTNTEAGAVYYWFIDVQGRTLILLMVGGPAGERTRTTFEALKDRVQQR
ncbi:MAG: hypothetical protein C4309_14260 [Chloroflexota bacterium]|mgnify:CR=1 FL=1